MKKLKTFNKPVHLVESIVCDVCNKEYSDRQETQEFVEIKINGGYSSIFGDGDHYESDLCQYCVKEILGKYLRLIYSNGL